MTIGFVYWFLFFFFIILQGYIVAQPNSPYGARVAPWLMTVLLFLLGWGIFGFIVRGPGGPF